MTSPTGLPDDMATLTNSISRRVLFECNRYHPSKLSSRIHSNPALSLAGTSTTTTSSFAVISERLAQRCPTVHSPCHLPPHLISSPGPMLQSVSSLRNPLRRLL